MSGREGEGPLSHLEGSFQVCDSRIIVIFQFFIFIFFYFSFIYFFLLLYYWRLNLGHYTCKAELYHGVGMFPALKL